jgi:predicted ATPase
MVPRHIACSLGCQDNLDETALDVWLKDYLHKRQGLLILDNFEHVIQAALFISDLLDATTGLHILVTSREPLMLYGEQRLEVSPLSLPTRLYDSSDVELESIMQQYEAVRLFVERAQNILAYFKLTRENFHAIIDICTHLDGIPLLIELAASRVAVYSPQHMVKELHHRLTLASGYYRDKHWRQQNAHVLLEWSYQLLEPYEQFFFVQLAIFKGYFRMEAAEAICSTGEKLPVKSLLEALIHKSLLRQTLFVSWFPHFFMLETIREYALERLKEQDGYPQLRQRHAEYYKVALEVALATSSQSDRKVMLDALQPEQENLRVALEWFQEQQIAEQAEHMASMLEMVFPT